MNGLSLQLKANTLPSRGQIDTVQNQRQLGTRDLERVMILERFWIRQLIRSPLQLLVPDAKPGLSPIQNLDAIASAIDEDEQTSRQGILFQFGFRQGNEPVKALPHICRLTIKEHTRERCIRDVFDRVIA